MFEVLVWIECKHQRKLQWSKSKKGYVPVGKGCSCTTPEYLVQDKTRKSLKEVMAHREQGPE